MRSLAATLVLILLAATLGVLAAWQMKQGNFDALLGAPPVPIGGKLYPSLKPESVRHIRISGNGANAAFSLGDHGWQASSPWNDRMDPRAAVAIIHFAIGMRVEDFASAEDLTPDKSGLGENGVNVRLEDADRRTLVHFKLGRVAPWKAEVEGQEQPVATVYVQPRDRHRKRHIYLCTGDINPLFKDGLKFLRDHRPFYFNPVTLQKVRIRSDQGDLTLGRGSPQDPWRIVKPLDLPTDPKAMKTLLEGIFELRAARLSDKSAVTTPAADNPVKTRQIALSSFGSDAETLLDIFPPESPETRDVKAVVSDRPDTVFDLPIKPEPGLVTLANLPLSVNELRDPTLTHLNIQSLRGISIRSNTAPEVLITCNPPQPWMATIDGVTREASEENLYALLKAVTSGRAIGFESDAATDFTPWGLDRPFLTLRFLGQDNQALELRFGIDAKGGVFVNRLGTPTVMRIDPALVSDIAVRPFEWRHSRLWSLSRVYLLAIERREGASPPLELEYNDGLESWKARRNGADASGSLDPVKANFMLGMLEGLRVTRWLATDDAGAIASLSSPSLSFKIREKTYNDQGDFTGFSDRTLTFAPAAPGAKPGFFYGRLNTEPHPFLLDSETYRRIAVPLTDD